MTGKRRSMKAITFEDFKKRIARNAKKGVYKTPAVITPNTGKPKRDSVVKPVIKLDTVIAKKQTDAPGKEAAPLFLKADSLITLGDFLFETNSFKLKNEHYDALDNLAKFLVAHPSLEVSISGHTDNTGAEHHNVSLSFRRSEVVAEYLFKLGVDDAKVTYEGFGSAKPIAKNDTPQGRTKNRRVEVLIKKSD